MRLPKFHQNRSIGGRVIAFPTFQIRQPSAILNSEKKLLFGHVTAMCSKFAALYQISSKLDHAFGLQTPTTAKCSMRGGCYATAVTMATASWRPRRGHDGMRLHKFHPNRSIGERVVAFPTFSNMAAVRHLGF